ncbi:hypothetical protein CRUP_015462 [Coryphaenoides rupestris]|nr:hypothetical protein CRUP_015462 [Coryphaenoides rupestris]
MEPDISPLLGLAVQPEAVECMRSLHDRVNIVPVLAKADSLTHTELTAKKSRLSIEDQEDMDFPYATRVIPPGPRPEEPHPAEGQGRVPETVPPEAPAQPTQTRLPATCNDFSPPATPPPPPPSQKPTRTARVDAEFQPLQLRRQLDQDKEYVGFATLPSQVNRKTVKKGFTFTLMVAGESGLGKSTLINSLFLTDLYKDRKVPNAEEEKGVRLRLNIIDTPGFGDAVNNTESWREVEDYVEQQYEQLRPLDVECMRALHEKVNIVPVLAKADSLTPAEVRRKKFKNSIPFAVIGSNLQVECDGRRFRVENPEHSDFLLLRTMLVRTHMQDLKDVTRENHYENYRAQCIQSMTRMVVQERRRSWREVEDYVEQQYEQINGVQVKTWFKVVDRWPLHPRWPVGDIASTANLTQSDGYYCRAIC